MTKFATEKLALYTSNGWTNLYHLGWIWIEIIKAGVDYKVNYLRFNTKLA
jgi:hypothetical protein